jgi:hypothetical protein
LHALEKREDSHASEGDAESPFLRVHALLEQTGSVPAEPFVEKAPSAQRTPNNRKETFMVRLRSSLFLLVVVALLLSVTPVLADTPAAAPWLDADLCTDPAPSQPAATPAASFEGELLLAEDFTLCSCNYCRRNPDEICQISPSGFSILCSDYYQSRC